MSIAVYILAGAVAILGMFVIMANYAAIVVSSRRQRVGIPGHVSGVALVGPLLVTIAWCIAHACVGLGWFGVVVGAWLIDPQTWGIAWLLLTSDGRKLLSKERTESDKGAG